MKKRALILLIASPPLQSFADGTEISLFTGYRAGGEFDNSSTGGDKVTVNPKKIS